MHQVTVDEVGSDFASVMEEVARGEEFLIMQGDKPLATLIPVQPSLDRRGLLGNAKDLITYIAEDFDETPEEFNDYMPA